MKESEIHPPEIQSPKGSAFLADHAGGHEFGTIGGGFDRVLLLTVEINDGLINSMHNPGYGAAGDKVMVEIGVDPCRGDDGIT